MILECLNDFPSRWGVAEKIANNHEASWLNDPGELEMDLHNNAVGRIVGQLVKENDQEDSVVFGHCNMMSFLGKLKTL
ncbi:DUF6973 domain-containing protein [Corynebacterium urogenitale]